MIGVAGKMSQAYHCLIKKGHLPGMSTNQERAIPYMMRVEESLKSSRASGEARQSSGRSKRQARRWMRKPRERMARNVAVERMMLRATGFDCRGRVWYACDDESGVL